MKFWKTVLFIAIPYGTAMLTFKFFMQDSLSALDVFWVSVSSLLFGIVFSYFARYFATRQLKKVAIELDTDEKEIKVAGANHMVGMEAVGGKLLLTNKRLVFKSHFLNIQTHQLDVAFPRIQLMTVGKTLGLLENVLSVTIDNQNHRFIVEDPRTWVVAITTTSKLTIGTIAQPINY
jgi:hypothetical protein